MFCLCAICSVILRLSLSSAAAGISPHPTSKRKMRSSKRPLASASIRLLLSVHPHPQYSTSVYEQTWDAQTEGGGFFLKPLKALIALDTRELFEDVWLAPPADAKLEGPRFLGRPESEFARAGISHPASELAREAGAGPSSTVSTHGSAAASERPCDASEGVTSQGPAVNSESAQASAGFATAGL